jgi:hypothetical protein
MVALHKQLHNTKRSRGDRLDPISQFYTHSLQILQSTTSEEVPEIKSWTVSSYEVEFGKKVGRGGFGDVYKAVWDGKMVAVKVFRDRHGAVPDKAAVEKEVEVCYVCVPSCFVTHTFSRYGAS